MDNFEKPKKKKSILDKAKRAAVIGAGALSLSGMPSNGQEVAPQTTTEDIKTKTEKTISVEGAVPDLTQEETTVACEDVLKAYGESGSDGSSDSGLEVEPEVDESKESKGGLEKGSEDVLESDVEQKSPEDILASTSEATEESSEKVLEEAVVANTEEIGSMNDQVMEAVEGLGKISKIRLVNSVVDNYDGLMKYLETGNLSDVEDPNSSLKDLLDIYDKSLKSMGDVTKAQAKKDINEMLNIINDTPLMKIEDTLTNWANSYKK